MTIRGLPSVPRFSVEEESPFPHYVWVRDNIQHKVLLGRVYPELNPIRKSLQEWCGTRHPSLPTLLRFEQVDSGLLALFRHPGEAKSLRDWDSKALTADQLSLIAWRWFWALAYIREQKFSLPQTDLSNCIWCPDTGFGFLGYELARRDDRHVATPLDVRYTPPEWRASQAPTEPSWIYIAASLLTHFLTGQVARAGQSVDATQRIRRLKRGWDSLLGSMLDSDPQQRPSFGEALSTVMALGSSAAKQRMQSECLALNPYVCHDSNEYINNLLQPGTIRSHTAFVETAAGVEVIKRLAPLRDKAYSEDYLILQTWAPKERGVPYQVANELIAQLDLILRELGEDELASHLSALSEWQDVEQIYEKWHPLSERLIKVMLSKAYRGVLLIIEDVHHLDLLAVEALVSLAHWVKRDPVAFVFTSDHLLSKQMRTLLSQWPYSPMRILSSTQIDYAKLTSLAPVDALNLLPTFSGENEVSFLYRHYEHYFGRGSYDEFVQRIWSSLEAREQLVLKVLNCSFRPLLETEIGEAMALRELHIAVESLISAGIVDADEDERLTIRNISVSSILENTLSVEERRFIWQQLLDYEQKKPDPDELFLIDLHLCLNLELEKKHALVNSVIERILNKFDLKSLYQLQSVADRHPEALPQVTELLGAFTARVDWIRQKPAWPWLNDVRLAWRSTAKSDDRAAVNYWRKVTHSKTAPNSVKSWALAQMSLCATDFDDSLRVSTAWREYCDIDRSGVQANSQEIWRAQFSESFIRLGEGQHEVVESMLSQASQVSMWVRAIHDRVGQRNIECVARYPYLGQFISQLPDLRLKARTYHLFGNAFYRANMPVEAVSAYGLATECYAQMGHQAGVESLRFNLATTLKLAGEFPRAKAEMMLLLRDHNLSGDKETCCECLYNLSVIALLSYDTKNYLELSARHSQLARQLKNTDERVRFLALRLHAARLIGENETIAAISELNVLLKKHESFKLLREESTFALRYAGAVVDQLAGTGEPGRFTRWRHELLDTIAGLTDARWPKSYVDMGDGLYRAYNLFILRESIELGWVDSAELEENYSVAFRAYANRNGVDLGAFIRKAFAHHGVFGDVPTPEWERIIQKLEQIVWWQLEPWQTFLWLLDEIRVVWPFEGWGLSVRDAVEWRSLPSVDEPDEGALVRKTLKTYEGRLQDGFFASSLYIPGKDAVSQLFVMPFAMRSNRKGVLWLTGSAQVVPVDRYRPLIRFIVKFVEWVIDQWNEQHNINLVADDKSDVPDCGMVGASGGIHAVRAKIQVFAPTDLHIHVNGESGTGKELVARAIHALSQRQTNPIRTVNCSQIPDTLIESHLFGHVRGAFTGAVTDKAGVLEMVDGGSLFIDEVGDIEPRVQSLLLRVIQQGEFSRVGEMKMRHANIRFVTATNKDLRRMIQKGQFREDLFYRIAEETLTLPPLRQRFDDLPLLARHFAKKHQPQRSVQFRKPFYAALRDYHWPGNVREFESYIRRVLFTYSDAPEINVEHVVEFLMAETNPKSSSHQLQPLAAIERENRRRVIQERLRHFGGNRSETARSLGLSRQRLSTLVTEFELQD